MYVYMHAWQHGDNKKLSDYLTFFAIIINHQ